MGRSESIDFRRLPTDPLWDRHLYIESNGQFRASLGAWKAAVLGGVGETPCIRLYQPGNF